MSKPAEQMVLEMMLRFPTSVPNATVAGSKMILFLGRGYVWSDDGGIVREDDGTEIEHWNWKTRGLYGIPYFTQVEHTDNDIQE